MIKFIKKHKVITGLIIIAVIGGGYYWYKSASGNKTTTQYVATAATRGTIITSVSGSGQVSASNQISLTTKSSGVVTYIGVKAGQSVTTGTILLRIDSTDAQKTIRDALLSLNSAKLSLSVAKEAADPLTLLQAQNSLSQAQTSLQQAEDNLTKAYNDGFNSVSNAFLDLPAVMTGLTNILLGYDSTLGGNSQWNMDYYVDAVKNYDPQVSQLRDDAYNKYILADQQYNQNFTDYKAASRFSSTSTIDTLISESYNTNKAVADAIKSANNLIQFYADTLTSHGATPKAIANTQLTNLNSYTTKINSHVSDLLGVKQTISNSQDTITSAGQSIAERTLSIAKLQAGTDPLSLKNQELSVQQRQNALTDAQQQLSNYYIKAPFNGVIASITPNVGDTISANAITLITTQKIAEVPLNEVDVSKVKVGQKATLTFDALPDLSIAGNVLSIDTLGTVSQGVVTYNVKVGFDTQDSRVKPGMSVTANIITNSKQNVILVPNSAVKTSNGSSYAQLLVNGAPQNQAVTTGLSNDTMTEITSGINEGDSVITQTITGGAKATTGGSSAAGGIRLPGIGGGGGGGNVRFGG